MYLIKLKAKFEAVEVLIVKYKKIIIPICVLIIIVAVALLVCPRVTGSKPFAKITADDVLRVSVQLLPPDETVEVVKIEKLVAALNDVVVYGKDNSYKEYHGQAVIYTITFTDGKELVVNAYNPFIIIDGIGYKTKYEPCERLSQIGNNLAN